MVGAAGWHWRGRGRVCVTSTMEFSLILQRLWRHRVLVALGVVVAAVLAVLTVAHVSLSPLSVDPKRSAYGAASTTLYVDTDLASIATKQTDTTTLTARAQIFARYINSGAVRSAAARQLAIPERQILVQGPNPDTPGQTNVQPAAQQRANALLGQGSPWTVFVDTEQNAPTFTLFTQADTGQHAIDLAQAITAGLQAAVRAEQRQARGRLDRSLRDQLRATAESEDRTISAPERRNARRAVFDPQSVVRPLGDPVGGEVADQVRSATAVGVFVAVVLVWCVLVLLVSGLRRASRRR
jgi:hypothetical protein